MISPETRAQIRRYFYAEHWKIGTIASELNVHPDAVRNAIEAERFKSTRPLRASLVDPYAGFIRQTLDQYPRLRATRIYQMIRDRGYTGSIMQLRRAVSVLRPMSREPFLKLNTFAGEQAQVDWAHFGHVMVGRAKRALSCFVMTLSYSRALYLEFFFDQTMENFLRGHVHAFQAWSGQPRVILYDNLKSAVLERRGNQIQFHPRLIELSAHYHFAPRPCQVRAGNQKGRVERAIRYVRDSFWAGRSFVTLAESNRQALVWRDQIAHQRRWPGGDNRTVADVFAEEQPRLLPLASICLLEGDRKDAANLLDAAPFPAQPLYECLYCARGEMGNRIKEQFSLFSDRTSTAYLRSNQLRLYLSSIAYLLLAALRRLGLAGTAMARAQSQTIQLKLLKIGALVRVTVRKVWISFSSSYPHQALFAQVFQQLRS